MSQPTDINDVALENCDNMPFKAPGYVQRFGCLIGLTHDCDETIYASENTVEFLGKDARDILGTAPQDYLPRHILHGARNMVGRSNATEQRVIVGRIKHGDAEYGVTGYVMDDVIVLEVTNDGDVPLALDQGLDRLRWLTSQFDHKMDVQTILEVATRSLRTFSGYDRVMAYRFRPEGSGEVVAQSRMPFMDDFLGLRFPDFDIPPRVKQLYTKTPIRMLNDITETPVTLLGKAGLPDLDMSLAVLRGTMPQHVQYLSNMGLRGSLTLPIVVDGALWGLFAFHHRHPRHLGGGMDLVLEFASQYLNTTINATLEAQLDRNELHFSNVANALFQHRDDPRATQLAWTIHKSGLLDSLPCAGVAVYRPDVILEHGTCPSIEALPAIQYTLPATRDGIAFSDRLALDVQNADLNEVAGVLCVTVGDIMVAFYRKKTNATVAWAGTPEKQVDLSDVDTPQLSPRASFARYTAAAQGHSDGWETHDLETARGLQRAMTRGQSMPLAPDPMYQNLELLVQELNHRVRNILTLVQSLVYQSKSGGTDPNLRFEALEERIIALASAHDQLSQNASQHLNLVEALGHEARPFPAERITLNGPHIGIVPQAASVFILVLHELFSNAAKYGSLSGSKGHLTVTWHFDESGLHLDWRETGGPEVSQPQIMGLGSTLIQSALPHQVSGRSEIQFDATGVNAQLHLPPDMIAPIRAGFNTSLTRHVGHDAGAVKGLENVLILEDDFIIGLQTKALLENFGAQNMQLFSNNEDAIEGIMSTTFDIAILDVNLAGNRSTPTAQMLLERDIPFFFITGYDLNDATLRMFPNVQVLKKPYTSKALAAQISVVLKTNTDT